MKIGNIMAVIQYSILILTYLIMALITFVTINQAKVCALRITEVLHFDRESERERKSFFYKKISRVQFNNVTFRYKGAENPVLNDISFQCNTGEVIGIIGGTGSGKSTIAQLIPHLHETNIGEILINGSNLVEFADEDIRGRIGYVPQRPFLFTGTVRENICYGSGSCSEEDMMRAASIAQLEQFIHTLDDGYDTHVEQEGKNLSGGQKQRICIARALIEKKDIYIFDDSFSALDYKTEAELLGRLKGELKDAIVIIIGQRVNSIAFADKIIVLEEGRISGIGSHKELLCQNELYKQIVNSQIREGDNGIQ